MDLSRNTREQLKVIDAEYRVESGHKIPQPVIDLYCRTADREYREITVEGFRPYFMMTYSEFVERTSDVINDRHVVAVEADLSDFAEQSDMVEVDDVGSPDEAASLLTRSANDTTVYHKPETFDGLDGTQLIKVYTIEPSHVGKIREYWDDGTWEADIPFTRRFLISSGIHHGIEVPEGAERVRYENWDGHSQSEGHVQEITPCDPPEIEPRMLVFDIEVRTNGGGVPDPANSSNEITAITSYDNYTGEYAGWILESEEWEQTYDSEQFSDVVRDELDIDLDVMRVFDHETQMIEDFHEWVLERNFDMVTGWNSNGFDVPYIIQRSYNISAYSIREWSTGDGPYNVGDEWPEPNVEGMVLFDMLDAYEKTQYRDLRSYKLEDVAQAELGIGKVKLEDNLDDAWHKQPIEFLKYNVRDVQAVVEIEQESALLELYDNMRQVTGAQYNTCNHNGPMLDTLFLRQAYDNRVALTTNYEPDQGDYHGAWVAEPVPGKHENVVYPDLASLYPYILWTLNISPETMYTSKEALRADGYTEADAFTAYIDQRDWYTVSSGDTLEMSEIDPDQYKGVHDESGSRKKKGSQGFDGIFDPQFDTIYFLKPDVKEGFIRKTVDLLVDLKYQYKGQGDMYAAVKRVTNSVYGVLGDSASGGKGFRLFDWKLAEAITLGGQKVIQYTADQYIEIIEELAAEEGYDVDPYLVGGDTDSVMTSIPGAPDYETALRWSQEASEVVGERYDTFMEEQFNVVDGKDEHKMDVEIESLGSSLFFMKDDDSGTHYETNSSGQLVSKQDDDAVKKRYAQHMIWDEDDGWLHDGLRNRNSVTLEDYESGILSDIDPHDHIGIKGFEYVRSDTATVTKEAQLHVLTYILLSDNPADRISDYLSDLKDEIYSDGFDIAKLGRPKSASNPLDDYGWKTVEELENDSNYTVTEDDRDNGGRYVSTPGPSYRGAKYADDQFQWEDISQGSKPVRFYVDKVRGDEYPAAYLYDSYPKDNRPDPPEVKRSVDAIAVDNPDRIPDQFVLDKDKMVQKELQDKMQPILRTIGEDWDGLVGNGRQVGLDAF